MRRATGKRVPGPRMRVDVAGLGRAASRARPGRREVMAASGTARRQRDDERTPSPAATPQPPHARPTPLIAANPASSPRRTRGCPKAHAPGCNGCSHAAGTDPAPAAPARSPPSPHVANSLLTLDARNRTSRSSAWRRASAVSADWCAQVRCAREVPSVCPGTTGVHRADLDAIDSLGSAHRGSYGHVVSRDVTSPPQATLRSVQPIAWRSRAALTAPN